MAKREIKYKSIHVREKLFNADFALVLCPWDELLGIAKTFCTPDKFEDLKKMVDKHGNDKWGVAAQFPFGGGGSVIWAKPEATIGTLVHEITHATHHLLKQRTVPLSEDTEEVYAYMAEFLFESFTDTRKIHGHNH